MNVVNVHQRLLHATPQQAGALIDSLSSAQDKLATKAWPRMKFDRPLGVGADGGHGPIRYYVEAYEPGHLVRFRFRSPRGFDGWHGFEVLDATATHCVLEHRVEMRARGPALLTWPLLWRWLHDALTEDALSQGQVSLGLEPLRVKWTPYVRFLRWLMARTAYRARPPQEQPHAG